MVSTGIERETSGESDVAGHQRVEAVHHALGRPGGAGGKHEHRHLIRGQGADVSRRRGREALLGGQQRRLEAVRSVPIDNKDMLKLWQLSSKRHRHGLVIEAAEEFWDDEDLRRRKSQHVAQFMLAKDRHQGIDDRADSEGCERDHGEFPPVRQLNGNDVAPPDPHALQRRRGARDPVAKLGVGEAPAVRTIRTISQQGQLIGRFFDPLPEKFVVVLVDPEPLGAHRLGVRNSIETRSCHGLLPGSEASDR